MHMAMMNDVADKEIFLCSAKWCKGTRKGQ